MEAAGGGEDRELLHTHTHTHTHTHRLRAYAYLAHVVAVEAAGGGEDRELRQGVADVHLARVAPRGEEVLRLLQCRAWMNGWVDECG